MLLLSSRDSEEIPCTLYDMNAAYTVIVYMYIVMLHKRCVWCCTSPLYSPHLLWNMVSIRVSIGLS